jgi:hypothetical protein
MPKQVFTLISLLLSLGLTLKLNAQEDTPQKGFSHFIKNQVSLMAGLNISKQDINVGEHSSRFNYQIAENQNNTFKAGYFFGFRIDGKNNLKDKFDVSISFNKLITGTNYKDAKSLTPFLGSFSTFKADDNFFILNLNTHYKKQIVTSPTNKRNLYLIAGPSIDIRLSNQSENNQVYNTYQNFIIRADVGVEFDNQSYYTLFIHYKQPLSSFTKQPIKTNLNSLEIGTVFKINDLF